MALPFLKTKKAPPIERVKELISKGFSEIEVIDILRKEGYSPDEIDLALSNVLKETIEKSVVKKEEEKKEEGSKKKEEVQTQEIKTPQETSQYPFQYINLEDYFNYIDYLIQNRVSEVTNQIKLLETKYSQLEQKLNNIIEETRAYSSKESKLEREIMSNFKILQDGMKELTKKIETVEEILKEVLPTLIESVRTLSQIIRKQQS
ncbi:MAG: hypothetical protein QXI09_02845 [Candidatus Aenigmatarchaeota archaeon]